MLHPLSLRADGVTRSNAPLAHTDEWRTMGEATADGGEVAYLRHAEVVVEENPGTLRCALRTGLWKSAVALRREGANRGMTFIQPLFGGFFAYGDGAFCRNEVFVMRLFCVGFCKIGK